MFKQNRISLFVVLSIFLTISYIEVAQKMWNKEHRVVYWDVKSYYAYLPSIIIHQDPLFDFVKDNPEVYADKFWLEKAENGNKVILTSMGLAILYSPFFILGHIFAHLLDFQTSGYSPPYFFFMLLGSLFYVILGLLTLRKLLLKFFSDAVTAITLGILFFGTNLLWYSLFEATMSHAYSFALFSFFIYFTIKWHKKRTFKLSVLLGLISGVIVLVRPTNILVVLFFIFYEVNSFLDLKRKTLLFIRDYRKVLVIVLFAFLVLIPQLAYWKYVTGSWFYYSYGDRGNFFFSNPQLLNGLFSYRKGWFIYTPIMLFAVLSIPLLFRNKELKKFFIPISLFIAANIYVVLSWWSWWYGGSLGLRAFIESYAFLALPLAALISLVIKQRTSIKLPAIFIIVLFALYGLFTNIQYYYGAIHWDSMTKEAYWDSFGRVRPSKNFKNLIVSPNNDILLRKESDEN